MNDIKFKNHEVLEGKYTYIGDFIGGYALVTSKDKKVGLINMKGEEEVPPIYDEYTFTMDGFFIFSKGEEIVSIKTNHKKKEKKDLPKIETKRLPDGKITYYNDNKRLFDLSFDRAYAIPEGENAGIIIRNNSCGFIRRNGVTILYSPNKFYALEDFDKDYSVTQFRDTSKNPYLYTHGLIDLDGNEIIPCIYKRVSYVDTDLIRAVDFNGNIYFYNTNGEIVLSFFTGLSTITMEIESLNITREYKASNNEELFSKIRTDLTSLKEAISQSISEVIKMENKSKREKGKQKQHT